MNVFQIALQLLLCLGSFCEHATYKNSTSEKVIYLMTLLPYPNEDPELRPSWEEGDNIRPVLELAKDQINNSTSLLQGYNLQLLHANGGCQVTTITMVSFTKNAFSKPTDEENGTERQKVTGIIGPGCSIATTRLGNLTNNTGLRLVHVHGSGNPQLADRKLYPLMLGTLGSVENYVQGFVHLLNSTSWEKVAILYDSDRIFYVSTLRLLLMEMNAAFLSPAAHVFIPLAAIREQILRVIFVLCPPELTRRIMCLAHNNSMIYENYQWVIMDKTLEELSQPVMFVYDRVTYNCSRSDMISALDKAILMSYTLASLTDSVPIANISHDDYLYYYEQYREVYNSEALRFESQAPSVYTRWAAYLYDAVWAWGLVLDNLTKSSEGLDIGGEYGNRMQSQRIVEQFYRTEFDGMSGKISFDKNTGYVERPVELSQINNSVSVPFAIVGSDHSSPPRDFTAISDTFPVTTTESSSLNTFFLILTLFQLMIVATLHVLTLKYRKRPSIKSASPRLLHISYAGTYITAMGIMLWTFNSAAKLDASLRRYICQAFWTWCMPLGFTVLFLPVVLRTWRIYRIFKHYLNPGPMISDRFFVGIVILAVTLVLGVGVVWTVVDPFYLTSSIEMTESKVNVKELCRTNYHYIWFTVVFTWFLAITVVPISVLLFFTRNIPNRSFTTESLRVFSAITIVILFVGFPLYYLTVLVLFDPVYNSSVLSVLINMLVASFTICVFVPPLLPVFKSKQLERQT